MTRIYIENNELELTADLANQITYSIDDIKKIENKSTSYSKTIVLAGTERNNVLFGHIFDLAHANLTTPLSNNVYYDFDASKSATARIDINGLNVIKGVLRLLSITIDNGQIEYEVAIFGEMTGFISEIAVKKLEDIDFSQYNHQWNYDNIKNSWDINATYISQSNYSFNGPYSSGGTPTYDYFQIRIDVICTRFSIGDTISVSGSNYNNGVYVIEEIFFFNNQTRINIKQTIQQLALFQAESGGGGLQITSEKPWGTGYVYPLMDYGVKYPSNFPQDHDFRHFRPALFVKEYITKIVENAGYHLKSNFFDTPFFRSLIIPNNDIAIEKRGVNYYVDAKPSNNLQNGFTQYGQRTAKWIYDDILSLVSFSTSNNRDFRYIGASTTNIKITAYFKIYALLAGNSHLSFVLRRKRSNTITTIGQLDHPNNSTLGIGAQGVFQGKIEVVEAIQPNDEIYVDVVSWQPSGYGTAVLVKDELGQTINESACYLRIEQDPAGFLQYNYDEVLEINKLIPKNIYQKDFFLAIVKMFNLMIVEDRDIDKQLNIEPYVDFYQSDRSTYLDWSYKVNREKPIKIMPMSEANSRLYEFKYKEDNDFYNDFYKKKFNEVYGNRVYDNQLEFSKDKSSIELIFSPTILVGYQDEDKVISTIYKYDEGNNIKKPQAHNIRILQIKLLDCVPWKLYNDDTDLGPMDKYLYAGHLDDPNVPVIDINWGAVQQLFYNPSNLGSYQYNLFYNFYSPYMAEIVDKDSRLVSCEMYLNEIDIANLDFSRLILIDGVLFRLQKVQDWSEGELCKVTLLRVINTKYYPAAPITPKALILRFADVTSVDQDFLKGNRYDVNKWSSKFQIPFNRVIIYGNYVYLFTTNRGALRYQLFYAYQNLIEIYDNIGCFTYIDDAAFKGAQELKIAHFANLEKVGIAAFDTANKLYDFRAPTCYGIGNAAFAGCTNLINIDLSNLGNAYDNFGQQVSGWCGDTNANNNVFQYITGNNITLRIHNAANINTDDDIVYLENNNAVNKIITY